jgi:hypothetical protein
MSTLRRVRLTAGRVFRDASGLDAYLSLFYGSYLVSSSLRPYNVFDLADPSCGGLARATTKTASARHSRAVQKSRANQRPLLILNDAALAQVASTDVTIADRERLS